MHMFENKYQSLATRRQRGSILITVVIITMVLSILAGSLLKYSSNEMRTNRSAILHQESNNAAESISEYGFAELQARWINQVNFSTQELRNNPLLIPSTAQTFYLGTNVVFDQLELVGGTVPPGEIIYIDPEDPSNQLDPQRGKRVYKRDVEVYAKAVTFDETLGRRESYTVQTLSVRDAPLFSHAIFYNMDLEFHPGPVMQMNGPVHSNGNIYVQSIDGIRFYSTLNAAGDIYHGKKAAGDNVHTQNGYVLVKNGDGDWVDFYNGSGLRSEHASYIDSRLGEAWRSAATNRWGGNVSTRAHDVPKLNMIGIPDYIPDNPATTTVNEKFNPGFAVIEPQVAPDDPNFKGAESQTEQISYKAGLVFKVDRVIDSTATKGYRYDLSAYKYQRSDSSLPTSNPDVDTDDNLLITDLDLSAVQAKGYEILRVNKYSEDADLKPTGGFYDGRQATALDVIEMDVGVLASIINNGEGATGTADVWNGLYKLDPTGGNVDWNGVVYVELPYDSSASTRADKVMPARRDVALRLVNGGTVPNPAFAQNSTNYDEGFTLATNGQLYIKGHFNADGLSGTGSPINTDDGLLSTSTEAPVALYADSITVLSSAFDDTKSKQGRLSRKAVFTEVSAAFVTGLLPTKPGTSTISGGAHNLPRFLEDWKDIDFRYRGSLVVLYESEAGIVPMGSNNNWYEPPNRKWGYNALFAAGIYPPGTPNSRSFKRTDFRYLTASEYNSALSGLDGFDPATSTRGHTISVTP